MENKKGETIGNCWHKIKHRLMISCPSNVMIMITYQLLLFDPKKHENKKDKNISNSSIILKKYHNNSDIVNILVLSFPSFHSQIL